MYIKLSTWAKENNVTYRTAWNYYNVICDTTDNAVNWINENLLRSKKDKTND